MRKHSYLALICGFTLSTVAVAQTVIEQPPGQAVERQLPSDEPVTQWVQDPDLYKSEAGDKLEVQDVSGETAETVKLKNVIPPIHFESGVAQIPPGDVELLRKVLEGVRHRHNVRLHLVGHADDQPLSPALARIFTDNAGLSRERAGEVAEFLQRALDLPPAAITYEWAGDTRPIAPNTTPEGRARNRRVEVEVWYDEPRERVTQEEVLVPQEFKRVKVCRVETLCKLRFKEGQERRARVKNLVPPLHYEDETTVVSEEFIEHIRKALNNLRDKQNVVVKFIGYTDDAPLTGRNARIYGDQVAFSKAKALRVALAVQEALKLPSAEIASDGRGSSQLLARNDTPQGRALNRRVEVQFWHDDPLQELPDEPQLCPATDGTEVVTRVYNPPSGSIAPLELQQGRPIIPPGYTEQLRRAMADISDKTNVRLRFIGYTADERLDRRTAAIYGDDVGLSTARAGRAMEAIQQQMQLSTTQVEHEGRGYVHSADVVNTGFTEDETSNVVVQVVYDEFAPLDDYEGVDITRLARELSTKSSFGLNLMHISVDGEPIDDPDRSSADVQRCTDVALDKADIQFQFDNLSSRPRLSVAASPGDVAFHPLGSALLFGDPVRFSAYANYWSFIERAEVRVFEAGQSVEDAPLAVVAIDPAGLAEWQPVVSRSSGTGHALKYILRAYGKDGHFDETRPQSLSIGIREGSELEGLPAELVAQRQAAAPPSEGGPLAPGTRASEPTASSEATTKVVTTGAGGAEATAQAEDTTAEDTPPLSEDEDAASMSEEEEELAANDGETDANAEAESEDASAKQKPAPPMPEGELLASYGESSLAVQNIRLGSGTVKVHGSNIPPQHTVWVAGRQVPVDTKGNFVAEALLPAGLHTVEVAVLDEAGNGNLYLRDLQFERKDRFYVGIADLTVSESRTHGPADQLQGANAPDLDSTLDGRLAFYVTQKWTDHWRVTASADTREGPVKDLFSNFLDKSPDSLFRRMDPDYHYPTFGDDSVVEELAPTMGKLYVKVSHDESHALWGNFKIGYVDNELTQVDRGLYGGNAHWQSEATTDFGEQRVAVDAFAAEPGTVASREEFRGTGGSLYFLHNQDILTGSERLRIELRDKDSGLVTGVVNLRPVLDYDIDYLQGRILLAEPLASTQDDNQLVHSSGLSGQEAYLVVRYEYTPGFSDINTLDTGGQGHYWLNDHVKIGLTASSSNEDAGADSSLRGADLTLRKSANSWLKLQGGRSTGATSSSLSSNDGGFGFVAQDDTAFADARADGYRADLSVGLGDFISGQPGRLTLYTQNLEAGYSAPGFASLTDRQQYGATFTLPLGERVQVNAKADKKVQDLGLETSAQELDVAFQMSSNWSVSTGVRKDVREDNSPVVPLTQEQGERTDAVVQVGFDSMDSWRAYAFLQDTLSKTENREDNGRIGVGSSYQFGERLRMNMEVSDGDFGAGGRLGTNYLLSDRTNLYLNYGLENERTDTGLRTRRGNLISGVKQRLSDSSSMYVEERYQDTDQMSGLTHATGVTLRANDRWNLGANMEVGTLMDTQTGAETKRKAGGIRIGYAFDTVQISSGIEYRSDDAEQPDATVTDRTTWLFRNNFKYQITPDWRLVGKLDHSFSQSSQGQFYDGGYTEAVIGYGYRPVLNDRLTALAKYTFFYNVPTTGQITPQNTAAQFLQKSHIASVDLTYDLTPRWSIGGKYAYRLGEMSLTREDPQFLDNTAQLLILRTDLRFGQYWEGLVEGRMLELPDLDEQRGGALLGIYRYLGEHVKAGAGYNFTEFSEDLTDLSFNHQGVFINVIGSM